MEGFRTKSPLLLIWKGSVSNSWLEIRYTDWELSYISSISHVNDGTVAQISPWPLLSKSFPVYY